MTDTFRALCAQLVHELENTQKSLMYHQGCSVILDSIRCALLDRARAALAEPELPADGEVAELVACLRRLAISDWLSDETADILTRAVDLLEQHLPPLSKMEDKSEKYVIVSPEFYAAACLRMERRSKPVGPTDEELDELFTEIDQGGEALSCRAFARAVLARWGRP